MSNGGISITISFTFSALLFGFIFFLFLQVVILPQINIGFIYPIGALIAMSQQVQLWSNFIFILMGLFVAVSIIRTILRRPSRRQI